MTEQNTLQPAPLMTQAIRDGSISKITELLGDFPNMMTLTMPSFGSWLHYAASHGSLATVQYLVKSGFDINSKASREGRNAIVYACNENKADIARYLIEQGAELDVSSSVRNPLFGAIVGRSLDCARLLLDSGIDATASYVLEGEVEIHSDAIAFAMIRGEHKIAQMIALHNSQGDESRAYELLTEGKRIADLRTVE